MCHCDSRYVGRTPERLQEPIKHHLPNSVTNLRAFQTATVFLAPAKLTAAPNIAFFTNLLLDNMQRCLRYGDNRFSVLVRGRSTFHLSAPEATSIEFLNLFFVNGKILSMA